MVVDVLVDGVVVGDASEVLVVLELDVFAAADTVVGDVVETLVLVVAVVVAVLAAAVASVVAAVALV